MITLSILGATGSIGTQCLDIVSRHPEEFSVESLTAGGNIDLLREQILKFSPRYVSVRDSGDALRLENEFKSKGLPIEVGFGEEGLLEAASRGEVVLNALVGFAGLKPLLRAIERDKKIALANKECLVCAGGLIQQVLDHRALSARPSQRPSQGWSQIIPVDSEHSSIFQCLQGNSSPVKKITLTASGGPFRERSLSELGSVTPEEAVRHPRWSMGRKISVDSATLMNKGLEIIEAAYLFQLPLERVSAVIHPQSIIHGLVEFEDNSLLASLYNPDMRQPISFALGMFKDGMRMERSGVPPLDLAQVGQLTFSPIDSQRFRAIDICREAFRAGKGVVLNGANEIAVEAFLAGRLPFLGIVEVIEETLSQVSWSLGDIESVFEGDRLARVAAKRIVSRAEAK